MTLDSPQRIVVAGGSTAGVAAVQELRGLGFAGEVHVIAPEAHLPYDRTALSKGVLLKGASLEEIALVQRDALDALDVVWHRSPASGLSARERVVHLADGTDLPFDGLVLATGSSARRLPLPAPDGVLTLRALDDAHALDRALDAAQRIVLVGGGFVGLEVAAVAAQRGLHVTVIEADSAPLASSLGPRVGQAISRRHERRGTTLLTNSTVAGFSGHGSVDAVLLADGTRVLADLVVVGVGARPNTAWLESSGLGDAHGVPTDETLATPVTGVVAAGDIARWPHPFAGRDVRIEHYEHAQASGAHAARRLMEGPDAGAYDRLPFVWSEQFDHTVHVAGFPSRDADVDVLEGDLDDGPFAVAFTEVGIRTAALTFDLPRSFRRLRRDLSQGAPA